MAECYQINFYDPKEGKPNDYELETRLFYTVAPDLYDVLKVLREVHAIVKNLRKKHPDLIFGSAATIAYLYGKVIEKRAQMFSEKVKGYEPFSEYNININYHVSFYVPDYKDRTVRLYDLYINNDPIKSMKMDWDLYAYNTAYGTISFGKTKEISPGFHIVEEARIKKTEFEERFIAYIHIGEEFPDIEKYRKEHIK